MYSQESDDLREPMTLVEFEMRYNLKIRAENYLNFLNAQIQNQQYKLQEQQNIIENNRLCEQRLQSHIAKQRNEYMEFWQTVSDQQQLIIHEMHNEMESVQKINENLQWNSISETEEEERFHQIIPATIVHEENNYDFQQFFANSRQEMENEWGIAQTENEEETEQTPTAQSQMAAPIRLYDENGYEFRQVGTNVYEAIDIDMDDSQIVHENTNLPLSSVFTNYSQNQTYQDEFEQAPIVQNLVDSPITFNIESNYDFIQLPPNYQTNIETEISRLDNLKSFRNTLEDDIRAELLSQYEKAETLRDNQELLRMLRQQLIQRKEIQSRDNKT